MGTKYFSGIIVYTIQNDKLRDEFRNIILTDLNCEELDQSSYGIPYEEGGVYKDYKNDIKSIRLIQYFLLETLYVFIQQRNLKENQT